MPRCCQTFLAILLLDLVLIVFLPFSLLLDVGDPGKARINLLAYIFTPKVDQQGIATGEETREVASWAPVQSAWWGAPERFMPIAGLADATFKAPFLPMDRWLAATCTGCLTPLMLCSPSWRGPEPP